MQCPFHWWVISVVVSILPTPRPCSGDDSYENVSSLMEELLGSKSGYNPDLRPRDWQRDNLTVNVSFALISLVEVDDVKQQITMNGFLGMGWNDERVSWNPEDYGGIRYLSPKPKDIWRPRLIMLNTLGDRDMFKDDYSPIIVYYDTTTTWVPGALFKSSCGLNMTKYPFDVQNCFMMFCAMSFIMDDLTFQPERTAFDLDYYISNEGWDIMATSIDTTNIRVGSTEDRDSCVVLNFTIKRKPGFVVLNVILPVLLLSFLNNFVFVIPDDSGEKISYGISVLLSLSVFLTTVSTMVPRASDNMPAITVYLFVLLCCSVLSILSSMLVVKLHNADEAEDIQIEAEENHRQGVSEVVGLHQKDTERDSEKNSLRMQVYDSYANEGFGMNGAGRHQPRVNKYKLISKHINKVGFVSSMTLWVIVHMIFFTYTGFF